MRWDLAGLKRPEHTGANRCLPCTVTNVVIAVLLGAGLLGVGASMDAAAVGVIAALCVLAASLAAIYFRGYLVPGTPTLTKRYFPDWLLRLFGKAERPPSALGGSGSTGPGDVLTTSGALEPCADGRCLTDAFRTEWQRAVDEADELGRDGLRRAIDPEGGSDVEFEDWGDAFRVYVDDRLVGKWRSRAAFTADLASVTALSARTDQWADLPVEERARALDRLRTRLETCPDCGSVTDHGTETVEGCCATHEATTVACPDCGARLYIETCPKCGSLTEYGTETVEYDDRTLEIASRTCVDCEESRVFALPPSLSRS